MIPRNDTEKSPKIIGHSITTSGENMLSRFYNVWNLMRLSAVIVGATTLICSSIKSHSWDLEIEYTGPGSEADRLNESTRDRENERAAERVNEGSRDRRDHERAADYERDHGV